MHVTLIKYFIHLFILKADLLPSSCINVQATFKSGLTAVLNRQNFEWNHSNFNKLFQETDNAYDFVMIFREVTLFDSKEDTTFPSQSLQYRQLVQPVMVRLMKMMRSMMKKRSIHQLASEPTWRSQMTNYLLKQQSLLITFTATPWMIPFLTKRLVSVLV